jgi:hypothetical protein
MLFFPFITPPISLVGIGFYQVLGKWHEKCLVFQEVRHFPLQQEMIPTKKMEEENLQNIGMPQERESRTLLTVNRRIATFIFVSLKPVML